MVFSMRLLVVLLLISGCASSGPDHEGALRRCKEQADEYGTALMAEDFDKVAGLTYPKVVEMAGGKQEMVSAQRAAVAKAKLKVLAIKFEMPEKLMVSGTDVLAVLPLTMEMQANARKGAGVSFFIGVSADQGKTWSFIDGAILDPEMLKKLLPHFPAGVKFPPRKLPDVL